MGRPGIRQGRERKTGLYRHKRRCRSSLGKHTPKPAINSCTPGGDRLSYLPVRCPRRMQVLRYLASSSMTGVRVSCGCGGERRCAQTSAAGPAGRHRRDASLFTGRSERLADVGCRDALCFFIENQTLDVISNVATIEYVTDVGNLNHQNATPVLPQRRLDAGLYSVEGQGILPVRAKWVAHRDTSLTDTLEPFLDELLMSRVKRLISADKQGSRRSRVEYGQDLFAYLLCPVCRRAFGSYANIPMLRLLEQSIRIRKPAPLDAIHPNDERLAEGSSSLLRWAK